MEGMIGEVRMFAGSYAPRSWAFCDGQLLPIASNSALFSILGVTYGGDGRSTFALPDLRGRVPVGSGNGPGLSSYKEGERGGIEQVILNTTEIPSHTHAASGTIKASSVAGTTNAPAEAVLANGVVPIDRSTTADAKIYGKVADQSMANNGVEVTIGNTGGNLSHENRQPFLSIYYIICLQGIFPPRS